MDNLKLIALRVGDMESDNTSSIRKSLKSNTPYYFYQGYEIVKNEIRELKDKINFPAPNIYKQPKEEVDYDDYTDLNGRDLNINICAIVGENGCGKSALIEIMMRIINNLACYLLGEYRTSWAADNLLYVEGVRASLFYLGTKKEMIDGKLQGIECSYKLEVNDRSVKLYENGKEVPMLFCEINDIKMPLDKADGQIDVLTQFFYTIVSNYSIYAYNTNDFWSENADPRRINIINNKAVDEFYKNQLKRINEIRNQIRKVKYYKASYLKDLALQFLENRVRDLKPKLEKERSWLAGLFHKNDGYMAPMVITPFRSRGNMDINNESFLAKNRLLSLIASGVITQINDKPIHRIELKWYKEKCFDSFDEVFKEVGLGEIKKEKVLEYSHKILLSYNESFPTLADGNDKGVRYALKYLVYKTLKISRNYSNYNYLYTTLSSNHENQTLGTSEVDEIIAYTTKSIDVLDKSHITLKIRQILSYLRNKQYDNKKGYGCKSYYIKKNCTTKKRALFFEDCISNYYDNDVAGVLPPPIFDTTIVLRDKSNKEDILFHTLSSGERQSSYFTSSVVYHLRNLDSVEDGNGTGNRVEYGSACLIFEEIELYFHPEMQRRLIHDLIKEIEAAKLKRLKSIQMVFVTHSPFILSDIPRKNCLFLRDGSQDNSIEMKTYGANIYDMLQSSFFLENGAIGEYAKKHINTLINKINYVHFSRKRIEATESRRSTAMIDIYLEEVKANLKDMKVYLDKDITLEKITQDLKKTAQSEIAIIDEPIIKRKLTEMFVALNIQ